MDKIMEMAMERNKAIDRCFNLGKQFINHFIKVMKAGGINDPDFFHHCDDEMSAWFNEVREIRIKPRSKPLNAEYLVDWFFTRGSSIDVIIPEEYEDIYSDFIIKLIANRNIKVSDALIEAINENS